MPPPAARLSRRPRLEVTDFASAAPDWHYWLSRPPRERLAAVEFLRRQMYGQNYPRKKFPRLLEVVAQASR
jgi:hypothetical protein